MRLNRAVLILFLLFPGTTGFSQLVNWNYKNILDEERESGSNPDAVIDQNGGIHISSWAVEEDRLIYLFRAPGTQTWIKEYVDITQANGYKSAISVDNLGNPQIAYFQNVNDFCQLRYAIRTGPGAWNIEQIPFNPDSGWGGYGPNSPLVFTERIKHSIDLSITPSGKPMLVCFDGRIGLGGFIDVMCPPPVQFYGLKLHQAYKDQLGSWKTKALGFILDDEGSCNGDTLPFGDRFGEYCSLSLMPDGGWSVACAARFTNDILVFRTTVDDTTWILEHILVGDSLLGHPVYIWGDWVTVFLTVEGVSMYVSPDGSRHLGYSTSLFYGENFCCTEMFDVNGYAAIDPLGTQSFSVLGDTNYRNYNSITGNGNDTLFLVYSDLTNFQFRLKESYDGGLNWTESILLNYAIANTPVARVYNDSLYIVFYDANFERLRMAIRSVDSGAVCTFQDITQSAMNGALIDAWIENTGTDTLAHLVYTDGFNDELFYSQGSALGGWNFIPEELDASGSDFRGIAIIGGPSGEPTVFYSEGIPGDLKIAVKNGAAWTYSIIDTSCGADFCQVALSDSDTLHVVYYKSDSSCLGYAKKHFTTGTWIVENIDCSNPPVGTYTGIAIDSIGNPHVSYYHPSEFNLKYAYRSDSGWISDTVFSNLPTSVGKYSSIAIHDGGLPIIAFIDEQNNKVQLAEQQAGGSWYIKTLDSTAFTSNGRPTDLELDQFGNPWVAYNNYSNGDLVALQHRDSSGWMQVSINPTGRIANSFKLKIDENDVYLIGRKTQTNNTGIAMLYKPNGIFIKTETPLNILSEVLAYPNPFEGTVNFRVNTLEPGIFSLRLFDLMGKEVQAICQPQWVAAGRHEFSINGDYLPQGIYFYKIEIYNGLMQNPQNFSGKVVHLKP